VLLLMLLLFVVVVVCGCCRCHLIGFYDLIVVACCAGAPAGASGGVTLGLPSVSRFRIRIYICIPHDVLRVRLSRPSGTQWVLQTRPRYDSALIPRPRFRNASRILHVSNVHERHQTLHRWQGARKIRWLLQVKQQPQQISQHTWFFPFPYPRVGVCVCVAR
jgi:hypothetical protein